MSDEFACYLACFSYSFRHATHSCCFEQVAISRSDYEFMSHDLMLMYTSKTWQVRCLTNDTNSHRRLLSCIFCAQGRHFLGLTYNEDEFSVSVRNPLLMNR